MFNCQQFERYTRADNIGDRIQRADFVEVDFLDRDLMNRRFDFSQSPKNANAALPHLLGQRTRSNDLLNLAQGPMAVVLGDVNGQIHASDARAGAFFEDKFHAVQTERADAVAQLPGIGAGVGQRAKQHVAADAGKAFQIADFHDGGPLRNP